MLYKSFVFAGVAKNVISIIIDKLKKDFSKVGNFKLKVAIMGS